jgi:hypothetical protein
MVQVINSNSGSFLLDDVYVQNLLPQATIVGANPKIIGAPGTGSWGPVGIPLLYTSLVDIGTKIGLPGPAALTDVHDLATDLALALSQSQSQAGLAVQGVRVTDGTDSPAIGNFSTVSTAVDVETATIGGTITVADQCKITFTSATIPGSPVTVSHVVSSEDTVDTIATALALAINDSAALQQAGIAANVVGAEITIKYVSTLTVSFSETVTAAGTETITLATGSAATGTFPGLHLAGKFTGSLGDQIVPQIVAGTKANTFTATIIPFPGFNNGIAEVYANIPGGASFWTSLMNAINLGQGVLRGPSNLVVASDPLNANVAPATGSTTMSGGTDGRNVTSDHLLGNPTPATGAYALAGASPAVSIVWVPGLTDDTIYPALQSIADDSEFLLLLTFPLGATVSDVITDVQGYAIDDFQVAFIYQWLLIFDSFNNQTRLVPPLAVAAGAIGVLNPWSNPSNKKVYNILGTERTNSSNPSAPFQDSDLEQLEINGIIPICKPIPQGNVFGFRNGRNSSSNNQANQISYTRNTNFILASFDAVLGKFVGDEQTPSPDDPLRAAIEAAGNGFFANLPNGAVVSYDVDCSLDDNNAASIANYQCNIDVFAQYGQAALDVVLTYAGGARVNTQTNTLGANTPALN